MMEFRVSAGRISSVGGSLEDYVPAEHMLNRYSLSCWIVDWL